MYSDICPILIQILIEYFVSKQWSHRSDPRIAGSDLGLHCLSMPYKKDPRLIWVNIINSKICILAIDNIIFGNWKCKF